MEKKVYGIIYLLIDGTNDMEYVGETVRSVKARFKRHTKADSYIGRAIRAHGEDMFVICVLKECYSKEELDYWEKRLIKSRDTMAPNGYNLTEGGDSNSNPSAETRAKFSAVHKGKKLPPRSPEHCAKISAANKGKHLKAETCAKLSVANSGENNPFFGKRHTAESLAKMSESHRGNTAWVGRHHRKESKAKMSVWRRADIPFKNLRQEMDKRQLTYKDLAEILELPRTTLPPKMRGILKFSAVEVIKLVEFFGKPAEYLFARDDGIPFSVCRDSPFKNLLIEMNKRKINYKKLAELLGLSNGIIFEKMTGRKNFTAKDKAKLVEIFGKPIEYLLARDDEN